MSNMATAVMAASVTAEDFFAHLRQHNPFIDNRINAPSADDVDVEELHRPAFERLAALGLSQTEVERATPCRPGFVQDPNLQALRT